jgi:hypothetical protein
MGTINYRAAAKRLSREVLSTGLFETSIGYNETYLKKEAADFWHNHRQILKARTPGFGWWIWKPEFIRLSLSSIPPGDGLMYLDAGSFVSSDPDDLKILVSYLNLAMQENVVGSNSQDFSEEKYCSSEILEQFNLSEKDKKSNQFYGGFLLLRNNPIAISLINDWNKLVCLDNHSYLIPKKSKNNHKDFVHHAYDQAIISCLLKKITAQSVAIGDKGTPGCIRLVRHKFGFKYLESNRPLKLIYKFIGNFSRVKLAIERRLDKKSLTIHPVNHL